MGRLHQIHVGVYAVGHPLIPAGGRWMAAVLAAGPAALLSHGCAAAHLNLLPTSSRHVEVTVPGTSRAGPAGIVVHRTRRLDPEDRIVHEGIPVTSVARTLIDIAGVARRHQLTRAVETAERLQVFDLSETDRVLARGKGRRGASALRDVLCAYREPAFTRSALERKMLQLVRIAGLPAPAANLWIAGGEADLVWEEQRLVVELDSRAFHDTRAAFERDRKRDAELQLAGYRLLRVTDRRLEREPQAVLADVTALLCDRR